MSSDEGKAQGLAIPVIAVVTLVGLYFGRKYFKGAQFTENVSAKGKIALVTGANSGIGMHTARELNLRGAKVYMLCRSEERAQQAKAELTKLGCDPTRLIIIDLDLASFSSIRKCSDQIHKETDKVDILINNAAVMFYPKFELTSDGNEITWQSNYLGHFLLTELLLPLLKKSENGRIINVSARLHLLVDTVDPSVVNNKNCFNRFSPYNRSKLAQIMHARELTRRIRSTDPTCSVTINALHPGVSTTNLGQYTILSKSPFRQISETLTWFFMKTTKDAAQTTLFLALSKSVDGISGKYFSDCKETTPSATALDDDACNALYNYSLEAVGLAK